jgi:hypothetical protein
VQVSVLHLLVVQVWEVMVQVPSLVELVVMVQVHLVVELVVELVVMVQVHSVVDFRVV